MRWITLLLLIVLSGCAQQAIEPIDRHSAIPADAVKMTPELDAYPPILHSDEFEEPVPLAVINTAGAEDSPFVFNDELYFFFTPDVRIPVEKQVIDGVTGIYVSKKVNGAWQEAERVILQDPGKLALDGCGFIAQDYVLFCTAREGYTGLHWARADRVDGKWQNWRVEDFDPSFDVGELHIHGDELYYHSSRPGGKGGTDIWRLTFLDGEWKNPINIEAVNTAENEGMPFVTSDGTELWFHRWVNGTPAVFRSMRVEEWQEPELIISQFAGEPTLDNEGNVYFVHHYYKDSVMLEADIYVAYKK